MNKKMLPVKLTDRTIKNASYKKDKSTIRAVKSIIKREENMKGWVSTIITILTVMVSSYVFMFKIGGDVSDIKNGITQNSKDLSELIKVNKTSVKRVSVLERKSDKMEIHQEIFKDQIKELKKK